MHSKIGCHASLQGKGIMGLACKPFIIKDSFIIPANN